MCSNQSVNNSFSECLVNNMRLLKQGCICVKKGRCPDLSWNRKWKKASSLVWICLSEDYYTHPLDTAGELWDCLPKSCCYICMNRFIVIAWIMHVGLFSVFSELKTRVGRSLRTALPAVEHLSTFTPALSLSPWQWMAWCILRLGHPSDPPPCTLFSAWTTAIACHHQGNSLLPNQRGTPTHDWVPPTRLLVLACRQLLRKPLMKVRHKGRDSHKCYSELLIYSTHFDPFKHSQMPLRGPASLKYFSGCK